MSKRIVEDTSLIKVADAIRNKCGITDSLIFPDGFESAIASIDIAGEGITPTGTIYITENNKTFDVTTYANAEVNIPIEEGEEVKLQTKAVTPNAAGWVLEPEVGYTGFSKVTISGDSDLIASNIKKNVNIFGVTGTYEGSGSSSGATTDRTLVVKTGTTTTATFDTGLSEIVTVVLERDTADSTGLSHMAYTPLLGILSYVGYSSYSEYVKNTSADCTTVPGAYCTIDGGTVNWIQTATSTVFIEGAAHTWWAIGYE